MGESVSHTMFQSRGKTLIVILFCHEPAVDEFIYPCGMEKMMPIRRSLPGRTGPPGSSGACVVISVVHSNTTLTAVGTRAIAPRKSWPRVKKKKFRPRKKSDHKIHKTPEKSLRIYAIFFQFLYSFVASWYRELGVLLHYRQTKTRGYVRVCLASVTVSATLWCYIKIALSFGAAETDIF